MKKPEKKNKTTEIIVFDDFIHFRRINVFASYIRVRDIKKRKPPIHKFKVLQNVFESLWNEKARIKMFFKVMNK